MPKHRLSTLTRVASLPWAAGAVCVAVASVPLSAAGQQAAASGDSTVLPTLEAVGTAAPAETATGPVKGFLATQSATATKTSTPIAETPQAVTVITRDRMQELNTSSISEAVRYSAGVSDYGSRDDPRGFGGTVRGFSPDIYLDGLRLPQAAASQQFDLEPYGLERIEVLRGASSALYGAGQLGGVINAVSKVPRVGQQNEMAIQGGSFGRIQGMMDVGGSLNASNTVTWRLNALARDSGTEFNNIKNNKIYVAPSLRWAVTPDTTVTLLASYTQIDAGSSSQFLPAAGTVLYNRYGNVGRATNNSDPNFDVYSKREASIGYMLEHRVNDNWTLRQNLRFAHTDLLYRYVTAVAFLPDNKTLTRQALLQSSNYNNLSLDNQSEAKFNTGPVKHDLLTGIDISNQFIALRRGQATAPSINIFAPVYLPITYPAYGGTINTNQTQMQIGFYAQDQLALDRFRLTLTGREDVVKSQVTNNNATVNVNTINNPSAFTYRTALMYVGPYGVSPYVSYATAFQPQTGTDRLGNAFVPQTGNQVEVGIKYQPDWSKTLFTIAAYDLTQQNVQTPDPVNTSYSVQTGEIRTRGVELEAVGEIMPGLTAIGTVTYQEPLVTKDNTAGNVGSRPTGVPSHMASAYLDKTIEISDRITAGFGGGVRYNGETSGTMPNTFNVPSQLVFDMNAHVDMDRWRLQVNGTNITDRVIYAACTRTVACSYGTGRAVYATLSYKW